MQNSKAIAYASRSLNGHGKNYSTIEKDLLAIVWATKCFRPYLFGRKFTIKADHGPLVWLQNLKEPNSKLKRWKIKLNEFDFDIVHIIGHENVVVDGLSRISPGTANVNQPNRTQEINLNEHIEIPSSTEEILEELRRIYEIEDETMHSAECDDTSLIRISEKPLNLFKMQITIDYSDNVTNKKIILYKNKIRHKITIEPEDDLLYLMQEILPSKGLVAIFIPNSELFLKFKI